MLGGAEDLAAVETEAIVDAAVRADVVRRAVVSLLMIGAVFSVDVELGVRAQKAQARLVVARDRADVLPVPVELVDEQALAGSQRVGDDVPAEVMAER